MINRAWYNPATTGDQTRASAARLPKVLQEAEAHVVTSDRVPVGVLFILVDGDPSVASNPRRSRRTKTREGKL